jgi:hypothetical protein
MLIIIIAILLIIYLITLLTRSRNILNASTTKIIRVFLFVLTPVLIILLIISHFNIYPRGYWVTKIIFWVVIVLTMVLFGLGDKSTQSKIERIAYGFFFYLPLGCIPFLLVPFIGIGTALLFYVSFIGDKSFILYSDENIRIQKQGIRFLGPDPPLEIYVKEGLFSHMETVLPMGYNADDDSLRVRRLNDSTYLLTHYAPDNWQVPAGFEEFKFSIKSN